jgi:hypothetical protein
MPKNFARANARGLQTHMGPATLGPSQILPGRKFHPSPPLLATAVCGTQKTISKYSSSQTDRAKTLLLNCLDKLCKKKQAKKLSQPTLSREKQNRRITYAYYLVRRLSDFSITSSFFCREYSVCLF